MEMCECTCGELLEPMSYKQCATYVSVPTVLMREGTSLTSQLATVVGPGCPVANCGSRMHIQRYLMQPMPSVITVALVWDAAVASDVGAVLQRVELQLEVRRRQSTAANRPRVILANADCGPTHRCTALSRGSPPTCKHRCAA